MDGPEDGQVSSTEDTTHAATTPLPVLQKPKNSNSIKSDHFARLGNYAELLWQDNLMTDVRLKVQEYTFNAHRAVLACYSPYLKKKLDQNPSAEMLVVTGIKASVLRILLDFMYTGELKFNCQTFPDVFHGAKRLKMKDVIEQCSEKLRRTTIPSFIYLYVTASKLNLHEKWNKAYDLILQNFEECIRTEEFMDLTCDQLCELLSADTMAVRSEIVVFLAALKWLSHNHASRDKHALRVLGCVRFASMSQAEILHCFKPPTAQHVMSIPEIKTVLLHALCYSAAVDNGLEVYFKEYSCRKRNFTLDGEISALWEISGNMEGKHD